MLHRCGHWGVNTCVRTCSLSWVSIAGYRGTGAELYWLRSVRVLRTYPVHFIFCKFVCNVNKSEGMARHCVDEDIDILTKQLITSLIGFQVIIVIVGISCLITNHIVPLWGCPFPRNRAIIIVKCVTKMYQIAILVFLYFIRIRSHLSTVIAWAASSPRGYDSDSRRSALIWKC